MKQYNVQITDRALNDMQAIYDYISGTLLAPEAALDQYGRIADAVEALSTFSERYRLFECEPERCNVIILTNDLSEVLYPCSAISHPFLKIRRACSYSCCWRCRGA